MEAEKVMLSGKVFSFLNPKAEQIDLDDIATGLSHICRYTGQINEFYSVAEHCVRVSNACDVDCISALMHDAAEVYIGDIITPFKKILFTEDPGVTFIPVKELEILILSVIGRAFNINIVLSDYINLLDRRMFATEVRDLMPEEAKNNFSSWTQDLVPFTETIHPWSSEKARARFLSRFYDLIGD